MIYFVFFAILLANILFAATNRNSKFLTFFTLAFVLLIFCGSRGTVDLDSYVQGYGEDVGEGIQILYYGPMKFSKFIGLDFYTFRFLYSLIAIGLFYFFIVKSPGNYHFLLCGYLCYLFFLDDIQIRNFLGSAFFMVALVFLLHPSKKSRVYFTIFTIISGLIHSSFLFYLCFLLIPKRKSNSLFAKAIVAFAILVGTLIFFRRDLLTPFASVLDTIDSRRTGLYESNQTRYGALIFLVINLVTIFMLSFLENGHVKTLKLASNQENMLKTIKWINYLSLLAFPFIVFNINFYRLLRNLILVNLVGLSVYSCKTKSRGFIFLIGGAYCFMWFATDVLLMNNFDSLVIPIFENNIFFNLPT